MTQREVNFKLRLIKSVEKQPAIWQIGHDYGSKQEGWLQVWRELSDNDDGYSEADVRKMWKILRDQWVREQRLKSTIICKRVEWKYEKALDFLRMNTQSKISPLAKYIDQLEKEVETARLPYYTPDVASSRAINVIILEVLKKAGLLVHKVNSRSRTEALNTARSSAWESIRLKILDEYGVEMSLDRIQQIWFHYRKVLPQEVFIEAYQKSNLDSVALSIVNNSVGDQSSSRASSSKESGPASISQSPMKNMNIDRIMTSQADELKPDSNNETDNAENLMQQILQDTFRQTPISQSPMQNMGIDRNVTSADGEVKSESSEKDSGGNSKEQPIQHSTDLVPVSQSPTANIDIDRNLWAPNFGVDVKVECTSESNDREDYQENGIQQQQIETPFVPPISQSALINLDMDRIMSEVKKKEKEERNERFMKELMKAQTTFLKESSKLQKKQMEVFEKFNDTLNRLRSGELPLNKGTGTKGTDEVPCKKARKNFY